MTDLTVRGDRDVRLLRLALFALAALTAVPAFPQEKPANSMEILRQRLKADKKLLVAANMEFAPAEAQAFWPLYEAYQADLGRVNERIVKLIQRYADLYQRKGFTDEAAKGLLDEALAIEQAEVSLKRSYTPKFTAVLPAAKAARYLQIESKIRAVVKYELADAIPVIP
jgi:hypothetical protein